MIEKWDMMTEKKYDVAGASIITTRKGALKVMQEEAEIEALIGK